MTKYSIITVCWNVEDTIEKTIKSVYVQNYCDYEYIIVDGASNDGTLNIINSYKEKFLEKGIKLTIVSEKDTGIYNAMNKGTKLSKGEWLLFLNAGDTLCANDVLLKFSSKVDHKYDIVYGDVIYDFHGMYKYQKCSPLETIINGNPFCHQSAFISRELMQEYNYNEMYKIAADFDFLLKSYKAGKKFKEVSMPVSCFELEGASTQGNILREIEHITVQHNNGVLDDEQYEDIKNRINKNRKKYAFRNKLKSLLPKKVSIRVRKMIRRMQGYTNIYPILENGNKKAD